jgi:uncharacterized damage-inducible protein DinB
MYLRLQPRLRYADEVSTPTVESLVLKSSIETLREHLGRIETCFRKLTDDQIWMRGTETQNAAGNLALHLAGNVRQWIICGLGGAEDHRVRHLEFDARGGQSGAALAQKLRATIEEAIAVIEKLTTAELIRIRNIQGYETSGVNALLHVVEHFAQHTGQIILITKALTGEDLGFYRQLNPQPAN